ncbi:cupin domain-containing protein [Leptolyngbya sp. FACHB-17]|uniref:cupin domain-containing protein n=1 Tax=unclassified Leptolyngbya TaxID=2650499 RepID=UPI001680E249|nr:cupin domain-containing protein [Leptolyngbya sp. FACHB-17]MBD2078508.1 cupin domain-containing protein [Leptolyngbya sp. FACHB-17]
MIGNIFEIGERSLDRELFEPLIETDQLLIERIISTGQTTPEGEWYNQPRDEWVLLLQGEAQLMYEDGSEIDLKAGNYLLIPAHQKHRVSYTSNNPACIWLAIHALFA